MLEREDRRLIGRAVLRCRQALEEGFDEALRLHGLLADRKIEPPVERREMRRLLEAAIEREGGGYAEARRRYLRGAAFTFMNRLFALRLAEAHGLIAETVTARPEYGGRSRRERDLADANPELALSAERCAHEALRQAFAEMQRQGLVQPFREEDPYGLLLPPLRAYERVRSELNALPERAWRELETLGWAYQFFNSEERREIRSRLRRNPAPDDIPSLNQFYTPAWIVRALVHNTLGRLFLERHPDSPLRRELDYLVPIPSHLRPPPGFPPPVRQWKVLDPACGSGHFLLGAFDLLLRMWREEEPDVPAWRVPALILERNLYGVDIDPRACQIAAIALYLKARIAFERLAGDDPQARFEPERINVVCADVRLGTLREEQLGQFDSSARLYVEQLLEDCRSAPEIGSLLAPRRQLSNGLSLFSDSILRQIQELVRRSSEANDMGSLLFGLDAERAVHLVEVLGDRYEVVLMNPPYGPMPPRCKEYARRHYPRTHRDYYAAFIERAVELCEPGGYVGALTGRTFLFLKTFQGLREEILRKEALPELIWDLGFNVLDEATARYAAFTLRRRWEGDGLSWSDHPVTFFRLTPWDWDEKRLRFEEALQSLNEGGSA